MARRPAMAFLWCLGLVVLITQLPAQPPTPTIDEVTYRAPDGKIVEVVAETKESAAGVSLIVGGKTKDLISPADIIKLEPRALAGVDAVGLGLARNLEKSNDLTKAVAEYTKLQKGLATAPERSRRFVAYKEAILSARIADQKMAEEFKAEAGKAVVKLAAFTRANKKSWEVWPAGRTAARLYNELGQFNDAAAILDDLSGVPGLPKELQVDAKIAQIVALIRGKQSLTAEGMLATLEKDAALTPAHKDQLNILRVCAKFDYTAKATASKPIEQIKQIDDAISAAKDPAARAIGFNFMGDLYLVNEQNRDAMWSYLWTDTVYNVDKGEQLYALSKLAELADRSNDEERANFFRERMVQVR